VVAVKIDDHAMMGKDVRLGEVEFPVEDLEELSLYPIHVSLAENAGGDGPVDVPQRRVIDELGGNHEGAEEHSLTGPVLCLDVEIWLGPSDIHECDEEDGDLYRSTTDDVQDETLKGHPFVSRRRPIPGRRLIA